MIGLPGQAQSSPRQAFARDLDQDIGRCQLTWAWPDVVEQRQDEERTTSRGCTRIGHADTVLVLQPGTALPGPLSADMLAHGFQQPKGPFFGSSDGSLGQTWTLLRLCMPIRAGVQWTLAKP